MSAAAQPPVAAAAPPPLVLVDGLSFAYDERPVLRGLSLRIETGDFVGIVGPNGSGKSTLLDLIDGVLKPSTGVVMIGGRPVHTLRRKELARKVAFVPQHFALDFDLSVRDVVEMGAYCRDKECRPRNEAEAALGRLGIAELAERRFPELSGGEQQLVVLAQALAQGSRLLLLDEPASSLDVSHQLRLFDLLRQLNAEGLTVVCVLHDLNLALACFDKALVLSNGEVAAWGATEEALTPQVLEAVYGIHASLHRHAGRSYLTFVPRTWAERPATRGRVHVVCGGGTGSSLLRELVDAGYEVSAGVLNALDSDEVTGRELALPMAVEAAFSDITDAAHAENLALIAQASVVVLTDIPVGPGNARNIEAVRRAIADGKTVLAAQGVLENDFDGIAATLLGERSPRFLPDVAGILDQLRAPGGSSTE